MAIDKFVNIVFDDSNPIVVYATVEHLQVPDEELFDVFVMHDKSTPCGFVGIIAGLDTAKFVAEKYHAECKLQCAIVAEAGGKTVYWPEPDPAVTA